MAVKIRLRRTGKKNAACFRVIVADGRSPRDGKFLEIVGFYDPRQNNETLKMDRIDYWLSVGAQPSNTVASIIDRAKTGRTLDPNRVKIRKKYQPEVTEEAPAEKAESKES